MSNSFFQDLTGILAGIVVEVDANETILAAIRTVDVPAIQTNIDANETKIDAIAALIPQNVRGDLTKAFDIVSAAAWEDVVNITNSTGKLYSITHSINAPSLTSIIRITVDGILSNSLTANVVGTGLCIYNDLHGATSDQLFINFSSTDLYLFNLEFSSSLRVEHQRATGTGQVHTTVLYNLDNF